MPVKRTYNIKSTKDFLVLAGVFFFLCLWAIKDAWYPSPNVLKKHPRTIEASFEASGSIGEIHVGVGDSIAEEQLLAELLRTKLEMDFNGAKKEYTETKNKHVLMKKALLNAEENGATESGIAEIRNSVVEAKDAMGAALKKVGDVRDAMGATELHAPAKGEIKEVLVSTHSPVEAGEAVLVIDPKDHFYLFNQSLAIFSFIAFWVFISLHFLTA